MNFTVRPDNFALHYNPRAYHNEEKRIIGRTAAGNSFLKAYFQYFQTDVFGITVKSQQQFEFLVEFVQKLGLPRKVQKIRHDNPAGIIPFQNEFILDPVLSFMMKKRNLIGSANYSICGYTHAISPFNFTNGLQEMRYRSLEEWDALICASTEVRAAVHRLLDYQDEHLIARFGKAPARCQTPVIPLGIHTKDFQKSEERRQEFRKGLNCAENEVVILTLSRLDPAEKFDPYPAFLALERAQHMLGDRIKLHYHCCGWYNAQVSSDIFTHGAKNLMPSVTYSASDGQDPVKRAQAFSGSDFFLFPIDNFQESFGLAPVEAMAAGLPVVATDWDGIKDTVTEDVGFRVPTSIPEADSLSFLEWNVTSGLIDVAMINPLSNMYVSYDIDLMAKYIAELARNQELRKRMSEAAIRRAESVYDWSVVIPQIQSFMGDLTSIRRQLNPNPKISSKPRFQNIPHFDYLKGFATEVNNFPAKKIRLKETGYTIDELLQWRNFDFFLKHVKIYEAEQIKAFVNAIKARGEEWCELEVANFPGQTLIGIQTMSRFLIKYGFAEPWVEH